MKRRYGIIGCIVCMIIAIQVIMMKPVQGVEYKREGILNYDSDITIQTDGEVLVTEKIQVYTTGNQIQKGIYRDFPTQYQTDHGKYKVGFKVLDVKRDGKEEQYEIENLDNGKRIKIGNKNVTLEKYKNYTYTIQYQTNRQIGFFDNYDEIYWNVTGNGWDFPIQNVTATIHLPNQVDMKNISNIAYTGKQGEKGNAYKVTVDEENHSVIFKTTGNLNRREGITISTTFPKGIVIKPDTIQEIKYFAMDNGYMIFLLIGVIGLSIACYRIWKKKHEIIEEHTIVPNYYPPEGLSPAEVIYLDTMGGNRNMTEATLLSLAVKGYLKLEDTKVKKETTIKITKTNKSLSDIISKEEAVVYQLLEEETTLKYSEKLSKTITDMGTQQREVLSKKYDEVYYHKNKKKVRNIFIIIFIVLLLGILLQGGFSEDTLMTAIVIFFGSIFVEILAALLTAFAVKNKKVIKTRIVILSIIGIAGIILSYLYIPQAMGVLFVFTGIYLTIGTIFWEVMKYYTQEGQNIKEKIEGFKMFIKTSSKDEIVHLTPQMFDQYFPYAYALGLQNQWAKKFETVLSQAQYEPSWYSGVYLTNGIFNIVAFTSGFSSNLSTSVTSSTSAPGSSSGYSGGGFSGGGGGRRRRRRLVNQ